jgi:hypothetical protein
MGTGKTKYRTAGFENSNQIGGDHITTISMSLFLPVGFAPLSTVWTFFGCLRPYLTGAPSELRAETLGNARVYRDEWVVKVSDRSNVAV